MNFDKAWLWKGSLCHPFFFFECAPWQETVFSRGSLCACPQSQAGHVTTKLHVSFIVCRPIKPRLDRNRRFFYHSFSLCFVVVIHQYDIVFFLRDIFRQAS